MNSERESSGLDRLIDEYRAIGAPPALLNRALQIQETQQTPMGWWLPTAGALASLTLFVVVAGYLDSDTAPLQQSTIATQSLPNMSSLTRLSIEKPDNVSLSQLNIRSLSMPAMPKAPKNASTSKSGFDSDHEVRIQIPKEKDHVYS